MDVEHGDLFYHERRAAEEQLAARLTGHPYVKAVHEKLARLHCQAADRSRATERRR